MAASPQEKTTITEQTTSDFRRDLDKLSADDRARVLETLRRSYDLLRDNPRSFFARAQRPLPIRVCDTKVMDCGFSPVGPFSLKYVIL